MKNDLVKASEQVELMRSDSPVFTPAQIQLMTDTVCVGATQDELKLFLYICKKTGLDPLKKQIYALKTWDSRTEREKMVTHTSIDGFRLIAQRSGKFLGRVGPEWCGEDRKWVDAWLEKAPPAAARVGIKHAGFPDPIFAVATFASFARRTRKGELYPNWRQMPDVMLAKCAESAAIRAAFPEDTSNLYSSDELDQAREDRARSSSRFASGSRTRSPACARAQLSPRRVSRCVTPPVIPSGFARSSHAARTSSRSNRTTKPKSHFLPRWETPAARGSHPRLRPPRPRRRRRRRIPRAGHRVPGPRSVLPPRLNLLPPFRRRRPPRARLPARPRGRLLSSVPKRKRKRTARRGRGRASPTRRGRSASPRSTRSCA